MIRIGAAAVVILASSSLAVTDSRSATQSEARAHAVIEKTVEELVLEALGSTGFLGGRAHELRAASSLAGA